MCTRFIANWNELNDVQDQSYTMKQHVMISSNLKIKQCKKACTPPTFTRPFGQEQERASGSESG